MASDSNDSGFGWGLTIGLVLGAIAGAYLASGPGRNQVESLTARTIELTGSMRRPDSPVRRALSEGITAARRRRDELDLAARAAETPAAAEPGPVGPREAPDA